MEERYSEIYSNDYIDSVMTKWLTLYFIAREKCGNFNYDDRYIVVKGYIDNFYADDYTQYVIDLINSNDLKDKNELLAIQNCEQLAPLFYWLNLKKSFDIDEKYYEERLKYHYDKMIKQIQKRD